jgi:hypothetical protein
MNNLFTSKMNNLFTSENHVATLSAVFIIAAVSSSIIIATILIILFQLYGPDVKESFSDLDALVQRAPLNQSHSPQYNPSKKSQLLTSSANCINKIIRKDYSDLSPDVNIPGYQSRSGWYTQQIMQGCDIEPEIEKLENIRNQRKILNKKRTENMQNTNSSAVWATGFKPKPGSVRL